MISNYSETKNIEDLENLLENIFINNNMAKNSKTNETKVSISKDALDVLKLLKVKYKFTSYSDLIFALDKVFRGVDNLTGINKNVEFKTQKTNAQSIGN